MDRRLLKSKIPTPLLFGIVLNVPIGEDVPKTGGKSLLIYTLATNLTLCSAATIELSDIV